MRLVRFPAAPPENRTSNRIDDTLEARVNRKDGTVYTAVLYRHNGRQSSVSFDDPAKAAAFRDLIRQVASSGRLEPLASNRPPRAA